MNGKKKVGLAGVASLVGVLADWTTVTLQVDGCSNIYYIVVTSITL